MSFRLRGDFSWNDLSANPPTSPEIIYVGNYMGAWMTSSYSVSTVSLEVGLLPVTLEEPYSRSSLTGEEAILLGESPSCYVDSIPSPVMAPFHFSGIVYDMFYLSVSKI